MWHDVQPLRTKSLARAGPAADCSTSAWFSSSQDLNSPGRVDHDVGNHPRVVRAPQSAAVKIVVARLDRLEPGLGVAAGNDVHLHAEGRDVKAVDHVEGRHRQQHGPIDRHVQLVGLYAVGILEEPAPLPGHHADLVGIAGRRLHVHEGCEAGVEQVGHDPHRDQGPGHFKRRAMGGGLLLFRSPAAGDSGSRRPALTR